VLIVGFLTVVLGRLRSMTEDGGSGAAIKAQSSDSAEPLSPGQRIVIPGVDFSNQARTLAIAVQAGDPWSEASAGFHKELLSLALRQGTPAIVLSQAEPEAQSPPFYGSNAIRVDFASLHVVKVPTIFMINRAGIVSDVWAGQVARFEHGLIRNAVKGIASASPYVSGRLDEQAAGVLDRGDGRLVFLDVRERGAYQKRHRRRSLNIPLDELEIRSRHELDQSKAIIIDCTYTYSGECEIAKKILSIQGFVSVAVMNAGAMATPGCREANDRPLQRSSGLGR
jgi:rhodanese-related sulfurtransferase